MYGQMIQRAMPLLQRLASSRGAGGFAGMGMKANQIGNDVQDRMSRLGGQAPSGPVMGQPQTPPPEPPKASSFDERFGAGNGSFGPKGIMPGTFPNAPPGQPAPQGNPFPTPMNGNPFPDPNANGPQGNPFPNPNANGAHPGFNPNVGSMSDPAQAAEGMKARQVMDPATGAMQNDFYAKSFPSFFNPNIG